MSLVCNNNGMPRLTTHSRARHPVDFTPNPARKHTRGKRGVPKLESNTTTTSVDHHARKLQGKALSRRREQIADDLKFKLKGADKHYVSHERVPKHMRHGERDFAEEYSHSLHNARSNRVRDYFSAEGKSKVQRAKLRAILVGHKRVAYEKVENRVPLDRIAAQYKRTGDLPAIALTDFDNAARGNVPAPMVDRMRHALLIKHGEIDVEHAAVRLLLRQEARLVRDRVRTTDENKLRAFMTNSDDKQPAQDSFDASARKIMMQRANSDVKQPGPGAKECKKFATGREVEKFVDPDGSEIMRCIRCQIPVELFDKRSRKGVLNLRYVHKFTEEGTEVDIEILRLHDIYQTECMSLCGLKDNDIKPYHHKAFTAMAHNCPYRGFKRLDRPMQKIFVKDMFKFFFNKMKTGDGGAMPEMPYVEEDKGKDKDDGSASDSESCSDVSDFSDMSLPTTPRERDPSPPIPSSSASKLPALPPRSSSAPVATELFTAKKQRVESVSPRFLVLPRRPPDHHPQPAIYVNPPHWILTYCRTIKIVSWVLFAVLLIVFNYDLHNQIGMELENAANCSCRIPYSLLGKPGCGGTPYFPKEWENATGPIYKTYVRTWYCTKDLIQDVNEKDYVGVLERLPRERVKTYFRAYKYVKLPYWILIIVLHPREVASLVMSWKRKLFGWFVGNRFISRVAYYYDGLRATFDAPPPLPPRPPSDRPLLSGVHVGNGWKDLPQGIRVTGVKHTTYHTSADKDTRLVQDRSIKLVDADIEVGRIYSRLRFWDFIEVRRAWMCAAFLGLVVVAIALKTIPDAPEHDGYAVESFSYFPIHVYRYQPTFTHLFHLPAMEAVCFVTASEVERQYCLENDGFLVSIASTVMFWTGCVFALGCLCCSFHKRDVPWTRVVDYVPAALSSILYDMPMIPNMIDLINNFAARWRRYTSCMNLPDRDNIMLRNGTFEAARLYVQAANKQDFQLRHTRTTLCDVLFAEAS